MIHTTFVICPYSSQNEFVPQLLRPLGFSSGLVRHILLLVNFIKLMIPDIGSIDKCHTIAFNAIIRNVLKSFEFRPLQNFIFVKDLIPTFDSAPPGWLSGERVGLMTWLF